MCKSVGATPSSLYSLHDRAGDNYYNATFRRTSSAVQAIHQKVNYCLKILEVANGQKEKYVVPPEAKPRASLG